MNTSSPARRNVLFAVACALGLMLLPLASLRGEEKPVPPLPLAATFEKVASAEGTPFILHLKNDSKQSLKLSGKVLLSVVNHAMDKARILPEHTLAGGEVWTVSGLSSDDRVIVSAAGFAPLEVRVPFKL